QGQRHRDRGDAQPAGQPVLEGVDLLAHGAAVADDAARPVEHAFAFRREILEPRAAIDQKHAETILELLDAGGEGRLCHAAGFGGPAEMLFARQREQEFELIDHSLSLLKETMTLSAICEIWKYPA